MRVRRVRDFESHGAGASPPDPGSAGRERFLALLVFQSLASRWRYSRPIDRYALRAGKRRKRARRVPE